ncbi:MAG: carboxylesterase family protein [Gammaproteobacteria bacterium]|nr:carboxylesterase family protein [Gammaproteobacteria bacterium]
MKISSLFNVVLLWLVNQSMLSAESLVSNSSGTLRGKAITEQVNAFLGVRFAADTSGDNRWRPPQPVLPWQGSVDATEFGADCLQLPPPSRQTPWGPEFMPDGGMSEDCLFLNVWALMSALQWIKQHRQADTVFMHQFNAVPPAGFGSFHTSDVPYAFGDLEPVERTCTKLEHALSKQLSAHWNEFVKHGDPGTETRQWPAEATGKMLLINAQKQLTVTSILREEKQTLLSQARKEGAYFGMFNSIASH